jgi:hypothetical protein
MKKHITKFLLNILIYSIIAVSIYLLYSPLNNHHNNKTSSSIQFVYQQF